MVHSGTSQLHRHKSTTGRRAGSRSLGKTHLGRFREVPVVRTRGVVYVHSTPLAVCPHVEWAIARVLGAPVRLEWDAQPVEPGARRADYVWAGPPGTGGDLAA